MFLTKEQLEARIGSFLHARGDVSGNQRTQGLAGEFSPRTWRCFYLTIFVFSSDRVFSTHVEMFLHFCQNPMDVLSFLHARGDVSSSVITHRPEMMFSPRTWRCFTPVLTARWVHCFLHARGDVSRSVNLHCCYAEFSPRTWRCFYLGAWTTYLENVFSTHVEMFLDSVMRPPCTGSFLHACGDVSSIPDGYQPVWMFSPRIWRCFYIIATMLRYIRVFSTHVEMFLIPVDIPRTCIRFLHACGDVSSDLVTIFIPQEFSPRMWRCFFPCIAMNAILRVFSTHVEMFLLLQVRKNRFIMFSPRMWRCFALYPSLMIKYNVFSTHVEMFLYHPKQLTHKLRFLHACGDVSISLRVKLTLVQFSPRMWRCFLPQDGSHRQ